MEHRGRVTAVKTGDAGRGEPPRSIIRMRGLNLPWKDVLHLGTRLFFQKNQLIAPPEGTVRGFYYLSRGTARLCYGDHEGRERIVFYIEPGTLFHENPVLECYHQGTAFMAVEDCEVWFFRGELLKDEDFVAAHPKIIINLLHSLSAKTRAIMAWMCELGAATTVSKVCRLLLNMSNERNDAQVLRPGITHEDMAALLGVHRTTLARALRQLREEGVIEKFTKRELRITDMERLVALASEDVSFDME